MAAGANEFEVTMRAREQDIATASQCWQEQKDARLKTM